jgi:threonine/homoserine/homoserine lactone efflux protein
MLRQIGVALSVGLADSVNPTTIGPGLYLATGPRPVRSVTQFTLGTGAVNLGAGLVLTIGPGRLLLGLVPHPHGTIRHVIELVAGVVLLLVALGLWLGRRRLGRRELPKAVGEGSSAFITGASIAAIELPTAAAYFAVIGSILASTTSIPEQVGLLIVYNVAFVAPLLGIIGVLLFAGERAEGLLARGGAWVQRRWPEVLAGLLLLVGSVLALLGGTGLLKQ